MVSETTNLIRYVNAMSFRLLKAGQTVRRFTTNIARNAEHEYEASLYEFLVIILTHFSCKLLIVGGGTGGCTMAAKFAKNWDRKNDIIIVEPSSTHYYQPLFTLVGGGIEDLSTASRPMKEVLPTSAKRITDFVQHFDPNNNTVITSKGDKIKYEYMIVAVGLQLNYDKV